MDKYRSFAEGIRARIESGVLVPGDALPSIRSAANREGLGVNTVRAAYELLQGEGLVESRQRGGYYVACRPSLPPAPASGAVFRTEGMAAFDKIGYLQSRAGSATSDFSLALPDPGLLPVPRLARLLARDAELGLGYGDPAGEGELRARIAAQYSDFLGPMDPADVVVTNGATEALALCLRAFVRPGDEVLVESPCYFEFLRLLALAGARVTELPLRPGRGLDLEALEAELARSRPRLLIVQPVVQNPTGAVMDDRDKAALVALAGRAGLPILEDGVYADLAFAPARPKGLGAFGAKDLVHVASFSKSLSVGLRVGWLHAPGRGAEFARLKAITSLGGSRPAQLAVAAFLEGRAWDRHLGRLRSRLRTQVAEYLAFLGERLPPGSGLAPPGGGCLLWVSLPPGVDGSAVFEAAAREGILVAPGELFSASPFHRGFLRLNAGRPLDAARARELARLCELCVPSTSPPSAAIIPS